MLPSRPKKLAKNENNEFIDVNDPDRHGILPMANAVRELATLLIAEKYPYAEEFVIALLDALDDVETNVNEDIDYELDFKLLEDDLYNDDYSQGIVRTSAGFMDT